MNNQELFALMDHFDASAATSLKLTTGEFTLELKKGGAAPAPVLQAPSVPQAPSAADPSSADDGKYITAPLVGTFYAAPSPDAAPFVRPGDRVRKGETVCLLEAMKMMSEVPAPCDCIIETVCKNNGELVAFGEPLFRYKPC